MTPHPEKLEQLKKHLQQLHNDGFKVIADCESLSIELASQAHTPAAHTPFLATFDFEKFDNNVQKWMEAHDATIRNQTPDGFCKGLVRYIQEAQLDSWTDDEIIKAINCCKVAEESLRHQSTEAPK